jgi:hypothetical protein
MSVTPPRAAVELCDVECGVCHQVFMLMAGEVSREICPDCEEKLYRARKAAEKARRAAVRVA